MEWIACDWKVCGVFVAVVAIALPALYLYYELEACGSSGGRNSWKKAQSIYEFEAVDIDGNNVSLDKYRGHVCLIVNVATKCGFTDKNYKQLQALHDEFADSKGLRILAFPCNQFGSQEPGTNEEIKKFATEKYGVKFDMFAKIEVNKDNAHPLWKYLKMKQGGTLGNFIKWNFSKFLVDKDGQPVNRYAPNVEPFAIKKDFEKLFSSTSTNL